MSLLTFRQFPAQIPPYELKSKRLLARTHFSAFSEALSAVFSLNSPFVSILPFPLAFRSHFSSQPRRSLHFPIKPHYLVGFSIHTPCLAPCFLQSPHTLEIISLIHPPALLSPVSKISSKVISTPHCLVVFLPTLLYPAPSLLYIPSPSLEIPHHFLASTAHLYASIYFVPRHPLEISLSTLPSCLSPFRHLCSQ